MTTTIPCDLQELAADLGVALPLDPLDWDRVRSRFLIALLERLPEQSPEVAAVIALHQRVLAGDAPSRQEWAAERAAQHRDLLAAIKAEQGPPVTAN